MVLGLSVKKTWANCWAEGIGRNFPVPGARQIDPRGEKSLPCFLWRKVDQPCEISKRSDHTGHFYRRVDRGVEQGLDVTEQLKFRAGGKVWR